MITETGMFGIPGPQFPAPSEMPANLAICSDADHVGKTLLRRDDNGVRVYLFRCVDGTNRVGYDRMELVAILLFGECFISTEIH